MINVVESVTVSEFELCLIEFTYLEMITFEPTGLSAINDIVLFSQKLVSMSVLEEHCILGDVI